MSIYHKYAPDGTKIIVLYYVDDCVYWYNSADIGKWFLDTIGNRFHVNFLGYAYWFMLIRISQMKDHYISVNQYRYATSIFDRYLCVVIVTTSTTFYNTTLPSNIIITKADVYTSDEKVENLTR